jgi:4-alpha-glucanotransferase
VTEIHQQLARANASMAAVQLDDIAGRRAQQNLPGTVDSYPNWQLKAPFTVDEIATSQPFARLAADMAAQDRTNQQEMETGNDLSDCSNQTH